MAFNPPMYRRGDAIRATDRNAQNAEIKRLGRVRGSGGLAARSGAGGLQVARVSSDETIFMKLTATYSGGYAWQEVVHKEDGTWMTTSYVSSSADLAYERNGNTGLDPTAGTIYELRRSPTSGIWLFDQDN